MRRISLFAIAIVGVALLCQAGALAGGLCWDETLDLGGTWIYDNYDPAWTPHSLTYDHGMSPYAGPIVSAKLSIGAYDVDNPLPPQILSPPERALVEFLDQDNVTWHSLGYLTGADGASSTSFFDLLPAWLGTNTVRLTELGVVGWKARMDSSKLEICHGDGNGSPELSTWMLLACSGLAGVVLRRRRKA